MTSANPALDEARVRSFGYVLVGFVRSASEPARILRSHVIETDEDPIFGSVVEALSTLKSLSLDDICGNQPLADGEILKIQIHRVVVEPDSTASPTMEIRK